MVQILSIKELLHFTPEALELYKTRLCNAIAKAPTELEKEGYRNQLYRVLNVQNNRPREAYCIV